MLAGWPHKLPLQSPLLPDFRSSLIFRPPRIRKFRTQGKRKFPSRFRRMQPKERMVFHTSLPQSFGRTICFHVKAQKRIIRFGLKKKSVISVVVQLQILPTGSRLNCIKNCLRLNEIFMILDQENVLILMLFWKTTKPICVTPICISLFVLSWKFPHKSIIEEEKKNGIIYPRFVQLHSIHIYPFCVV